MKATFSTQGYEFTFDDSDVVNPDDFIPAGDYNPHNIHPFLLHDHGFTVAVVFASNLQDALDTAVDEDRMDRYLIDLKDDNQRSDYLTDDVTEMAAGFDANCPEYTDANGKQSWWRTEPSFLGNASEPFDIESLGVVELPNPKKSFCSQFMESFPVGKVAQS